MTLPIFKVEPGERLGTINVTCPRRACGGKAVLSRRWLELGPTAPCAYCFKTARRI